MSQERNFERINQKQRTRAELLRAAIELTEKGGQPSVADVADHAGISRATAYRYFSNPEDLIREAVLHRVSAIVRPTLEGFEPGPAGVPAAVADVVRQIYDMVVANEPMFRALLSSTVVGKDARRVGRRIGWLDAVLEPLRPLLPAWKYDRLLYALALLTGIETVVVLKDVCGLDNDASAEVAVWASRTLLAGVLDSLEA